MTVTEPPTLYPRPSSSLRPSKVKPETLGLRSSVSGFRLVPQALVFSDVRTEACLGVSEYRGTLFWGPYNKDPTI